MNCYLKQQFTNITSPELLGLLDIDVGLLNRVHIWVNRGDCVIEHEGPDYLIILYIVKGVLIIISMTYYPLDDILSTGWHNIIHWMTYYPLELHEMYHFIFGLGFWIEEWAIHKLRPLCLGVLQNVFTIICLTKLHNLFGVQGKNKKRCWYRVGTWLSYMNVVTICGWAQKVSSLNIIELCWTI